VKQVVVIGAGMSGLCMGVKLKEQGIDDFVILERAYDVAGTWHYNTYPGAGCDVPSVFYSYSFYLNPNWSRVYSLHDEIKDYFRDCAKHFGLYPHIQFNTEVTSASYDDSLGVWCVATADGQTIQARILVSGLGQLNVPFTPSILGRETFGGESFHSARWNHDCDLKGKRVAIIGNAASALQFIPHVVEEAEHVMVYQRSANYVVPRNDRPYTEAEQARFARFPWWQRLHRLGVFLRGEIMYGAIANKAFFQWLLARDAKNNLEEHIKDPELRRKLTPNYPIGCKRILVSDNYYQAMAKPNLSLVTDPIDSIETEGVKTSGGEVLPADVLIFGTGFETTEIMAPVNFVGRDGISLKEAWCEGAEAYRGVCTAGFPNLFMLYGPNTNLGSNSIIFMVEQQVNYIVKCISKLFKHQLKAMEVNSDVLRAYNEKMQGDMAHTVWVGQCDSWYKNAAGKVTNNWPNSATNYFFHMREPDFSDFDLVDSEFTQL
jgi:cation diffusion facilitator CzcD-associated flavoprotein CzcO